MTATNINKHRWQRFLPITIWLPRYQRAWLPTDLVAGLAIWALTVPQALAYAGIAGLPPQYGLYAVPLAMLAYAIFGTSRLLSVGPDSATALLSFTIVSRLVAPDSDQFITATAGLAIMTGVLYLIFGLLRMGWVADFLAAPVMKGFVQGLALMVIVGQLPKLFGVDGGDGGFFRQLWTVIKELPSAELLTVAIGLGSLAFILALKRFVPKAPGSLITVVAAILFITLFDLSGETDVVGTIETGMPKLALPGLTREQMIRLVPGALILLLVGYTESLGAAKAAATGEEIDANQELIAQGMANAGSGISTGFIVAGSLSRTSVVGSAGGRSQVTSLVNAFLVVLTILFLMPFFANLPQATLGAVVIAAMAGVLDLGYFARLRKVSTSEFFYSMVTFLGELVFGVLMGVLMGVAISLAFLIHRASRPSSAVLGRIPGEETYRDLTLHPEAETIPGLLFFRFDADLIYVNAGHFVSEVQRHIAAADYSVQEVVINAGVINKLDSTGADALIKLQSIVAQQGVRLSMAYVRDPVREFMVRAGVEEAIGPENIYESVHDAAEAFLARKEQ